MSVRDFFIRLPYFCKSDDPELFSVANEIWYDYEIKHSDSVLRMQKKHYNWPFERVKLAFAFTIGEHNREITDFCKKLATLLVMGHRKVSHGDIEFDSRIANLVIDLQEVEPLYPEVSAVLSVKTAAEGGGW